MSSPDADAGPEPCGGAIFSRPADSEFFCAEKVIAVVSIVVVVVADMVLFLMRVTEI